MEKSERSQEGGSQGGWARRLAGGEAGGNAESLSQRKGQPSRSPLGLLSCRWCHTHPGEGAGAQGAAGDHHAASPLGIQGHAMQIPSNCRWQALRSLHQSLCPALHGPHFATGGAARSMGRQVPGAWGRDSNHRLSQGLCWAPRVIKPVTPKAPLHLMTNIPGVPRLLTLLGGRRREDTREKMLKHLFYAWHSF